MSPFVKLMARALFCPAVSIASSPVAETGMGENSLAMITLPERFYRDHEGDTTIFIMPRDYDPDGPISMRLSCQRDLAEMKFSVEQIEDLLMRLNPGSALLRFGANLATTQKMKYQDETGTEWNNVHYAVCAGGLLITVTVQTIKGREKEPQCKELLDEVPRMLASLRRKPSQ